MHDIRWIREEPEAFDAACARRGLGPLSAEILAADTSLRGTKTEAQEAQAARNAKSKEIGKIKSQGGDAEAIMAEVSALKDKLAELEDRERGHQVALDDLLSGIPNVLADDVPEGTDEEANIEVRAWGEPGKPNYAKEHFELGEALGWMDFEAAAAISGSRFVALSGPLARLERALGQFMLDMQTLEFGYTEISGPLLVRDEAMFGTGQLPKFAEDSFRTENGFWLIPTSEVMLTNLVREQILRAEELPLRFTSLTPCFRSEAGAAGRDTRGMIRQHQFTKVEMVSITAPEDSDAELERMTGNAEAILQKLGLPYRVMLLCAGDTGFSARKTYDLEVWLPGQGRYREISSCSTTGGFQARRMKARFRAEGEKQTQFVHTLNGSGLAVGRTLIAMMEAYQREDGSIEIPEVLRPYMGGLDRIEAKDAA